MSPTWKLGSWLEAFAAPSPVPHFDEAVAIQDDIGLALLRVVSKGF